MACNCIRESEQRTYDHLVNAGKEQGVTLMPLKECDGYDNKMFILSGDGATKLYSRFEYKSSFKKVDGSQSKEKTGRLSVVYSYCPFCGVAY